MFANRVGAPACGFLADFIPANRLSQVYGIGFLLRTLSHGLTWPAMGWLTRHAQSMSVLGLLVLSIFWEMSRILHEHTVQHVGSCNFGKVF